SAIAEAFRLRGVGTSYAEIAAFLDRRSVRPSSGNPHWSAQSIRSLLMNRVYLGEARGGHFRNPSAHEPLVTQAEFDAAQGQRSLFATRDGSIASRALLGGLLFCAGCGHTLKVTGTTDPKSGERAPVYYCKGRYASGLCPARASARAEIVDAY